MERLDDLNLDGLKIYQNVNGYNFTSDSVLLANFVYAKKTDVCVEIGAGSGVISILVRHKVKPKKIYAFEIQKNLAELCKKNVDLNNMQDVIEVFNEKIQNFTKVLECESADIIFCNPPYFKSSQQMQNPNEEIAFCRHEKSLTLDELCECAKKLLKFSGRFFIIYPASRLCELIYKLKTNNLEPKQILTVQPNIKKSATVVLVESVKGGREGVILKSLQ